LTTTTITELENRDKEHDEQIEKLEKEIKAFKEYQELLQDTDAGNLVIIPYLKKQISELKKTMISRDTELFDKGGCLEDKIIVNKEVLRE